jgi:hypothetical protein
VTTGDPYRRCGLAANPFAHGGAGEPAAWVDRGLPPPPAPGGRRLVQVIGVKGAGKTSTLRRWRDAEPAPWRYVPRGARRLRPLPVAPLVYWDEVDRAPAALRRWALRTAARRGATVVAGTHADFGAQARRAGLAVDTVVLPPITAGELTTWAGRRLTAVGAGPDWALPAPVAADVAARAGASWRAAGDLLHVWVAREVAARCGPSDVLQ